MKRSAAELATLSRLLDEALELPNEQRAPWIDRLDAANETLKPTLRRMLLDNEDAANAGVPDVRKSLDAAVLGAAAVAESLALTAGASIGPYELIREIGRGGMGAVWSARRVEGLTRRLVALKLPHPGLFQAELAQRLARERDILEGLTHPNIARLYDAGISPAGQPYLALEYIEGTPITDYCKTKQLDTRERIGLIRQIADAIQYAHAQLVIHRDLKPANILVNDSGRAMLLDFGIAKLLSGKGIEETALTRLGGRALTPDYASPEQIAGQTLGIASDVYSLGVVIYELLTGQKPYQIGKLLSIEQAFAQVVIARPSGVTSDPATRRALAGDLDTIVLKALKIAPSERYATIAALADDLDRHMRGDPVLARPDSAWYRIRRFSARNKAAVAAVGAVIVALATGTSVALWQAHRAEAQAARATATKDFLVSLFRASDPRVAQDKPRKDLTAKQLLDIGSARIEKDFASQPELQIELLGMTAQIYDFLSDEERFAYTRQRTQELARAYYGPSHPIVISALLGEADSAIVRQDFAKAARILADTDVQLRTAHLDRSLLRAIWWARQSRLLLQYPDAAERRFEAVKRALTLFAQYGPDSSEYASALNVAATDARRRGDQVEARRLAEQALAAAQRAPDREDTDVAIMMVNLALADERAGLLDEAETAFDRAEAQMLKSFGSANMNYWFTRGHHGFLSCYGGRREAANRVFASMVEGMPTDWKRDDLVSYMRQLYGACLSAQGRAAEAIPLFEEAHRGYLAHEPELYMLRELDLRMGDAYDQVGRLKDARAMLSTARDEVIKNEKSDAQAALQVRERWARFLLDHAAPGQEDFVAAEKEFALLVTQTGNRTWVEAAQAHSGLARVALALGDGPRALTESREALAGLDVAQGFYDIRIQPRIWLVHSAALRQSGDAAGARAWANKAWEASRIYDVESADSIRLAAAARRL